MLNKNNISLKNRLYIVTGDDFSKGRPYIDVVQECIKGGAGVIQLREKDWPVRKLIEIGAEIRKITKEAGVLFIVNDRVDLAIALEADGVHVGQRDMPLRLVRKVAGSNMIVGVSASTLEEALTAEREGADYIGAGPVFPTETKKDASLPKGFKLLKEIRDHTSLPLYAIGGIKIHNVASVIEAGADGAAVVSAVVGADDIAGACREFLSEISKAINHK